MKQNQRKMGWKSLIVSGALMTVIAMAGGCFGTEDLPSATGPIDGSYAVSSVTCNGVAQSFGTAVMAMAISNLAGTFTQTDTGCVKTNPQTYTYPSSTTMTMADGATSCTPADCAGAGDCASTGGTAETYTYALSGSTLTLTRVDTAGDMCTAGETAIITLAKQ